MTPSDVEGVDAGGGNDPLKGRDKLINQEAGLGELDETSCISSADCCF